MTEFPIAWVVAASCTVDALAALIFLLVRVREEHFYRPSLVLGRVVGAILATSLVFGVKLVVLLRLGLDTFGLIHLVYVDLVVVVPVVAVALLILERSGRFPLSRPARVLSYAVLGLMPLIGIYATFIEPYRLREESALVALKSARTGKATIRIGVLTDLQTRRVTDHERSAIDRLMALQPDVILIPGDLFQAPDEVFERERPALCTLLNRLEAPGGVYFVPGDVDQAPGRVARLVEGTRIVPLVNEVVRVDVGDRHLMIGGIELDYKSTAALGIVHRLEMTPGDDDIRILLAHRPDAVFDLYPTSRVDLVVAGHTHGGQIVVPGFGPLMTLSTVPREVAAGGLHTIGANPIYVSRGVGCERGQAPRIRIFCPPEVTLLTVGRRD
jgi:predicted MPP superfamily phosphohydrolase